MMQLRMGVVYAERVFLCGDVIAKGQVKFKKFSASAGDGSDRIVRRSVCLSEDERALVRVAAPLIQDMLSQIYDPLRICTLQADDGERPFYDPCGYILVSGHLELFGHRRFGHSKSIVSALEMIVAQYGAAYDREICVGAQEVVGEQPDKVKQLCKCVPVNLHGYVLSVKNDAVLVVVYIGRVLEAPLFPLDRDGDNAVVFPGGMVCPARIPFILHAELALRVGGRFGFSCCGNGLGVFFRF